MVGMPGLGQPLPHLAGCIYLDYNATTPIYPQVSMSMSPFLTTHFGNPSSTHVYGRTCKAAVETARQQVARLIHASPQEVYFTACGTESDNWAICGAASAARLRWGLTSGRVPHVVCSAVEHPAVLVYLEHMQKQGLLAYTAVGCDAEGLVSPAAVLEAMTPDTVLVTIMHSNNEVGSIQPVATIAAAVKQHAQQKGWQGSVLVHTDAAQSVGKVPVHVDALGVDMATIVGHKFGAPKGVAGLYIREGTELGNYLHGGGQEGGRRAGTESVLLLVGLGAAAAIAHEELIATSAHMAAMRDQLKHGLVAGLPADVIRINGPKDASQQLPNTLSISIRGLNASKLLSDLADQLAASAGAACHSSGHSSISSVLRAMHVQPEYAVGTLRLSTGRHTTAQEIDTAVALLLSAAAAQGIPVKTMVP